MSEPPFEYDLDLIRNILIWAEHGGSAGNKPQVPQLALAYHVKIMAEAGFIEGSGMVHRNAATGEWTGGLAYAGKAGLIPAQHS